jgi:predicted 2-oxoglutarate/Fe(II)-dependent dioxygenase YbiX
MAIVRLRQQIGDNDSVVALTGVYHNLLWRWATV